MSKEKDKAQIIKQNIEATIWNAIEADIEIKNTTDHKKQRELLDKNERRAQAIPSMIRDMKEEEAQKELDMQ